MHSENKHAKVSGRSLGREVGISPRLAESDHLSQEAIAAERIIDDRRSSKTRRKT